jgi:hypothetical protein
MSTTAAWGSIVVRDVGQQDPSLFNPCGIPSPDGKLLLCETFSDDGSQNGIHVVRASDGGGLRRVTSIPGGDDIPGSWCPDGKRIVFHRIGPNDEDGVFVVNVNGTRLKQILPPAVLAGIALDWSPQGNDIVFSRRVTQEVHSSLWIVHSDGSNLRPLNVQPSLACGGRNDDRGRLLQSRLVVRRDENRLREGPERRRRLEHLHRQRRRQRAHAGHAHRWLKWPRLENAPARALEVIAGAATRGGLKPTTQNGSRTVVRPLSIWRRPSATCA